MRNSGSVDCAATQGLVERYARLWPREIFDYIVSGKSEKARYLANELPILKRPGVYILYRDDLPYYVGKASKELFKRLHVHARRPGGRYNNFWNYFSVFVIEEEEARTAVESILIAAFPTVNSAKPRLTRARLPAEVIRMWRQKRDIQKDFRRAKQSNEAIESEAEDGTEE